MRKVIKFLRSRTLKFSKGIRVLTHSDGLSDQLNPNGKKFSLRRIKNDLSMNPDKSLEDLTRSISLHQSLEPQTDDIVAFEIVG